MGVPSELDDHRSLAALTDEELLGVVEQRSEQYRSEVRRIHDEEKVLRDRAIMAAVDRGLSERTVAAAARSNRGLIWDIRRKRDA